MSRTLRVLSIVSVVVMTVSVGTANGARASSAAGRVEPRAWARAVCAVVLPVAESIAAESQTWSVTTAPAQTVGELVDEVELADRALVALARYTVALRDGIGEAGIPAVRGGARVVRHLRTAIGAYLATVRVVRTAFAGFLADHAIDPEGAVDRLALVLDSPEGRLRPEFSIDAESPALGRATRSVSVCVAMDRVLHEAGGPIGIATRLVRS